MIGSFMEGLVFTSYTPITRWTDKTAAETVPNLADSPSDMTALRDRWLISLTTDPETTRYKLDRTSIDLYGRILQSYARMLAVSDQLPPIIHPRQLSGPSPPLPLARCADIMRLAQTRSGSELGLSAMYQESSRLFTEYESYDGQTRLAALQALLLYGIKCFYQSVDSDDVVASYSSSCFTIDSTYMCNLHCVAYKVATQGLALPEELAHVRPQWEDWIQISAARRTIYCVYIFDCVFNVYNDLPVVSCVELNPMLAPEAKSLWASTEREQWEKAYGRWLVRWEDGPYRLGELMKSVEEYPAKLEREARWTAEVDDYGLLLLIVAQSGKLGRRFGRQSDGS